MKRCPRCKSTNVEYDIVNDVFLEKKKRGWLYKLTIGIPIAFIKMFLWLSMTVVMIFIKIFKPKNYVTKNRTRTVFKCKDCGYVK